MDVTSDVICPWCYVGKRRLEKAVAAAAGRHSVVVRWHPSQLNPDRLWEGVERRAYRTAIFGSWERSLELNARLVAIGAGEGIDFAFDQITRTPNTLDGHRLIRLADGLRVRLALDDCQRMDLGPGQRLRVRLHGQEVWLFVTDVTELPPVAWVTLAKRVHPDRSASMGVCGIAFLYTLLAHATIGPFRQEFAR